MDDLLEYLTYKIGCDYISDLPHNRWRISCSIRDIPDDRYTIMDWNEAIDYIFDVDLQFRTVHEAKEYVLCWRCKVEQRIII